MVFLPFWLLLLTLLLVPPRLNTLHQIFALPLCLTTMAISSNLMMVPKYIHPAQTSSLNFRLLHTWQLHVRQLYYVSNRRHRLICPNLKSRYSPQSSLLILPLSVSGNSHPPCDSNLGVILDFSCLLTPNLNAKIMVIQPSEYIQTPTSFQHL